MNDEHFKKTMTSIILVLLIVLGFFIIKPVLLSIFIGMILAFIFYPIYLKLFQWTKSKNLSAFLICGFLIIIMITSFLSLILTVIDQSFRIYSASQQIDFIAPLKSLFPSLFSSEEFSAQVGAILYSFVTELTNTFTNFLKGLIQPEVLISVFLNLVVTFFTFFFMLRDKDSFIDYIKSLLPFSKEVEKKLFESSKGITSSVLYGQVIIGVMQGIIVGIGFFIFGVPNALFLSMLAAIAGILPIIGTTIIWLPVVIYLLIGGNSFAAFGIISFGLISSIMDNFVRPLIVSQKTSMHSGLILIGMIGGLFLFGLLGLILGPLILAYLLIILELYRNKKIPGLLID